MGHEQASIVWSSNPDMADIKWLGPDEGGCDDDTNSLAVTHIHVRPTKSRVV